MLTSANVNANMAATYYAADNYYTAGEILSPAVWSGRLAKELGLEGTLEPKNFEQLLRGFGPDGKPLVARPELPFREVKKVSVELRSQIVIEIRSLWDSSGVQDSRARLLFERALVRKLDQGLLSSKAMMALSRKIESTIAMHAPEETPSVSRDSILGILSKVSASPERRAGLDLTLSAPKSVSLQALVFGDTRLIEAHRDAVREAMKYVEERFSQCRIGPRNERQIVTTGKLTIAHFEHDLSREKDPHLHTHNVVINMTPYDGKMRALHNDDLFQHKRLLGTLYQNELALRVRNLGYDIVPNRSGMFEIAGFERHQIEEFSKRHNQIWGSGIASQQEAREQFLNERKSKEHGIDREALMVSWKRTCEAHNLVAADCKEERGLLRASPVPDLSEEISGLTEKSVSVRMQDIQTARLASSLGQKPSNQVLAECEEFARTQLVPGKEVRTFTTEAALLREKDYRADVERGLGAFQPFSPLTDVDALEETLARRNIVSPEFRSRALTEAQESIALVVKSPTLQKAVLHSLGASLEPGKKLSPKELYCLRREVEGHLRADGKKGKERTASLRTILDPFEKQMQAMTRGQIAAVVSTLRSRDGVVVWQGVAGAGKTFSLNQLARVVESHGYVVRGLAPSAAAAKQLAKETRLFTETVDGHLLRNSEKGTLPELWIVDEAGMLSAKNFAALTSKAHSHGARLLLVGDTRQIPSVEAGNPFLDVQRNTKTTVVFISESVRPRTPLLQETVTKLYAKDARGVSWGLRQETLEAPTKEERCSLVTAAYLAITPRERNQTLVIAKTNEERRLLTEGIRSGLRTSGKLGLEAKVTTLRALDYTETQRKQIQNFVPGLVLKLNDPSKRSLKRDEAFVVVGKDFSKNALVVKDDRGRQRLLSCESLGSASVFRQETLGLAKGDRVLWTRNDRRAGAMNNDLFEVSRVSKSGITLKPAEGTTALRQKLPFEGLHHVDHAWAMTVHRSQGQTAKHVLLVADERTTASDLLVGVTRATQSVLVVAHDRTAIEKISARESEKEVAHEVALPRIELAADVERSRPKQQLSEDVEWEVSI